MSFTLNDDQKNAVSEFIQFLGNKSQKQFLIEGYAGTGKTTLVKFLLENMEKMRKSAELIGGAIPEFDKIAITATTRKAATVLAKSMGCEQLTIHSHLGLVMKNCYRTGTQKLERGRNCKPLYNQLIFIDEASFVDDALKGHIDELTADCKVVFMGDPCQLISPSCTTSPVFGKGLPMTQLKTVMRHDGPITEIAALYRTAVETGEFAPFQVDGKMVRHMSSADFQAEIDVAFTDKAFVGDQTCKVVAWTNDRVNAYNEYIADQRGITEQFPVGETLITNKPIMSDERDRVLYSTDTPVVIEQTMKTEDYGVPGYLVTLDCGHELFVPEERWKAKRLVKKLAKEKNWSDYFEVQDTWGDLRPAYSSTVHKSQGSTYERVFVDLTDIGHCDDPDAAARLLYVAVSRASKEVVLWGELPSHYMGVKDVAAIA